MANNSIAGEQGGDGVVYLLQVITSKASYLTGWNSKASESESHTYQTRIR
jgi:hypothetical protein